MQANAISELRAAIAAPSLVEMIYPGARGLHGAYRRVTCGICIALANRENREDAITYKLENLTTKCVHRAGDAIEPGIKYQYDLVCIMNLG